ncbi:MAG: hypothetical protein EBZ77_04710 [Chitinophagia bacterium]|nr:hypothetical protein [Chitinophagia bacterium]
MPFDSLVKKYSDDAGSKDNHGEYWFSLSMRPGIDTAFGNFAYEGNQGETKMVKGQNENYTGYHYVEILERKNVEPTVQVATIVKNLFPSDSTISAIFNKSDDFAAKGNTAQNFDAYAKKMGYDKRMADNIKQNSFTIQGIGASREIIKWAFAHKVGDVSSTPVSVNNEKYVVCKLTGELEKGPVTVTAATRPMLEQRVRDEKKADMIAQKFKGSSLEAIGQACNSPVGQSDSVSFAVPYIPNLGYEAKVAGYTFNPSFAPNTVSPGLKGQGGVYFISLLSKSVPPANPMQEQMAIMQQKAGMESQLRNYFNQIMQMAITHNAKIKYNMDAF